MRRGLLILSLGVFLFSGCSSGGARDRSPTGVSTANTPTPVATQLPTPDTTLPSDWDGLTLLPAPAVGVPCPVEADVCEEAFDLLARAHAGDSAGVIAASLSRSVVCPSPGETLPITIFDPGDACAGAATGEVRPYYVISSGGEGSASSPARFATALARYIEVLSDGPGNPDAYGSGGLAIAAIGCFRASGSGGHCGDEWITVTLTSSPAQGARQIACFRFHRESPGAAPRLDGIGCSVPPYGNLYSYSVTARMNELVGTFENYPWMPLARIQLPVAVKRAVEANLPLPSPLDGECLVAPPSGERSLCFMKPADYGETFEVFLAIPFSDAVWKYVLRRDATGSYSVESMVKQRI